jgi:hypothetical protein
VGQQGVLEILKVRENAYGKFIRYWKGEHGFHGDGYFCSQKCLHAFAYVLLEFLEVSAGDHEWDISRALFIAIREKRMPEFIREVCAKVRKEKNTP